MIKLNQEDYKKEYRKYKLRVLSKTNGRDIHRLNGLLGIILNQGLNYIYWEGKNKNKAEEILKILKNTGKEIFHLTGVSFSLINQN